MLPAALAFWALIGTLLLVGVLWRTHIAPHRARTRVVLLMFAAFVAVVVVHWQVAHRPSLEEQLVGKPISAAIQLLGEPDSSMPQAPPGEYWVEWSQDGDVPCKIVVRSKEGTIIQVAVYLRG